MAFPSGARQIPTSKMAFPTKNKVTVTRAGAEVWRISVKIFGKGKKVAWKVDIIT